MKYYTKSVGSQLPKGSSPSAPHVGGVFDRGGKWGETTPSKLFEQSEKLYQRSQGQKGLSKMWTKHQANKMLNVGRKMAQYQGKNITPEASAAVSAVKEVGKAVAGNAAIGATSYAAPKIAESTASAVGSRSNSATADAIQQISDQIKSYTNKSDDSSSTKSDSSSGLTEDYSGGNNSEPSSSKSGNDSSLIAGNKAPTSFGGREES